MSNSSVINRYEKVLSVFQNIQALIGIIGILCNCLAICVFRRKRLKTKTYSSYWIITASFEILLLLHTFRHWAKYILKIDIDLLSPIFCRFNEYQPYAFGTVCILVKCIITLDRFFVIVYPNRFAILRKRSFQAVLISLIITFSLLVNITLPLNYRLIVRNGTLICHIPIDAFKAHSTVALSIVLCINVIINPILDFKIIYHIVTARFNARRRNKVTVVDRQFAISAITINIFSLIIRLPFLIGNLFSTRFHNEPDKMEVIFTVCLTISLVQIIDIFLVNLIVNSLFRQEFMSMIRFNKFINITREEKDLLMTPIKTSSSRRCSRNQSIVNRTSVKDVKIIIVL